MLSLRDQINSSIYSAQTGKAPLGFQDIIADAPGTTPTTLGGVTVASNTWWKNKTNNASGDTSFVTASGNFYEGMLRMSTTWNDTSEGNEQPSNIFTTNDLYGSFEEILKALATNDLRRRISLVSMVVYRRFAAFQCSTTATAAAAGCTSSTRSI